MGNICAGRPLPEQDGCLQPKQLASRKFGEYGIYLDFGEIRNEEVDVIVAQTDVQLKLPKELARDLSPGIQQQLNRDMQYLRDKTSNVFGDVVYTHAGELDFDFVFYCVLPTDEEAVKFKKKDHLPKLSKGATQRYQKQFIYECMMKCLRLADELEIGSLCFPAMRSQSFSTQMVAAMQMLAVKNYLEEQLGGSKYLNAIRFCVGEEGDVQSFSWAFEKVFMDTDDSSECSDDENSFPRTEKKRKCEEDNVLESFGASYYNKMESLERKLSI